jgi:hypothetical protein
MHSALVVVDLEGVQLALEIELGPEEYVIEVFSTDCADQALDEGMRARNAGERFYLLHLKDAQVSQPAVEAPGRDSALLRHPPLRTVRDSFPSHGSSLYKGTLRHPVQQLRVSGL